MLMNACKNERRAPPGEGKLRLEEANMKHGNIKKLRSILIVCAFVLVLLTGCAEETGVPVHTHTAAGDMQSDAETHWKVCECGETLEQEAHTPENGACTVCGAAVGTPEDSSSRTELYNEYGDLTKLLVIEEGVVLIDESYEYEYDDDGHMLSKRSYEGDRLTAEFVFGLTDNGEVYTAEETYWYSDGSGSRSEYDISGNKTHTVNYHADGGVAEECLYEYSSDGVRMAEKRYSGSVLMGEYEFMLGETGEKLLARSCTYEEDGSYMLVEYDECCNETYEGRFGADGTAEWEFRYENEYDADGNLVRTADYLNGSLYRIAEFVFGEDENGFSWSMRGKITQYSEDGSVTVSEYDPDGAWATETEYDAAGNAIYDQRYEYDYDDNGNLVGARFFVDGRLSEESSYTVNAEGVTETEQVTMHFEDGGKLVSEYDKDRNLLNETLYDADGNVIGGV